MSSDVNSAITLLERSLEEAERKADGLRAAINALCEAAGLPARHHIKAADGAKLTQIKSDTFYGQKLQTAIRSFLEMRRAQTLGPATPREIFDALKAGGFQFGSHDDVAIITLRALLRKRTEYFHKLPNGTYGMTAWYPDAKIVKSDDDDDGDDEPESEPTKLKVKPKPKAATD